jgi:hypothetical protein
MLIPRHRQESIAARRVGDCCFGASERAREVAAAAKDVVLMGTPSESMSRWSARRLRDQESNSLPGPERRYPSRRILPCRLVTPTRKPSTCGYFFGFCPVRTTGEKLEKNEASP